MALRYALLGLLTKHSATGYELTQQFRQTLIHFWTAHHTQIYRELGRMEADQLVSSEVIPQEDHPDKKVYTIESKGYESLLAWLLTETIERPKLKDELLLRVSMFQLISKEHAISFLEKSKQQHQLTLEHMQSWKSEHYPEELPITDAEIGEYLTAEYGMRYMKNWIEWCDWSIALLHTRLEAEQEKREMI